jgi:hypothetical protein
MTLLSRLKLRTKLLLLLGLSALAVIASISLAASRLRDRMLDDRIDKLRAAAQMSIGLATSLEAQIALVIQRNRRSGRPGPDRRLRTVPSGGAIVLRSQRFRLWRQGSVAPGYPRDAGIE